LLVGHVSVWICSLHPPVRLGPPCRRPILIATKYLVFRRQDTKRLFCTLNWHTSASEKEAAARGLEIRVLQVPITPLTVPRARTTGQMDGLLKATIENSTQRILGSTILAAEAGEMISTVQAVMIAQLPATTLRDAVLSHPTVVDGFNALFAAL
jgi:hypothetical protein